MNARDLNIGDVFKVTDHPDTYFDPKRLWRKETNELIRAVTGDTRRTMRLSELSGGTIEVVERASPEAIRRAGNMLVLKGGDVLLEAQRPLRVIRLAPREKFFDLVLSAASLRASESNTITQDTALPFEIRTGAQVLNRPPRSTVLAYQGRVYGRATSEEVTGKKTTGGYKRMTVVDGIKRMTLTCVLTIPDDAALFDVIQDLFVLGSNQP
jgi:hypothetical protein